MNKFEDRLHQESSEPTDEKTSKSKFSDFVSTYGFLVFVGFCLLYLFSLALKSDDPTVDYNIVRKDDVIQDISNAFAEGGFSDMEYSDLVNSVHEAYKYQFAKLSDVLLEIPTSYSDYKRLYVSCTEKDSSIWMREGDSLSETYLSVHEEGNVACNDYLVEQGKLDIYADLGFIIETPSVFNKRYSNNVPSNWVWLDYRGSFAKFWDAEVVNNDHVVYISCDPATGKIKGYSSFGLPYPDKAIADTVSDERERKAQDLCGKANTLYSARYEVSLHDQEAS